MPQKFEGVLVYAKAILDLVGFEFSEWLREFPGKGEWDSALEAQSFGAFPGACVKIDILRSRAQKRSYAMSCVVHG